MALKGSFFGSCSKTTKGKDLGKFKIDDFIDYILSEIKNRKLNFRRNKGIIGVKKTQQTGKQAAHRLNDEITGLKEVRLNGLEGDSLGIVSLKEALTIAEKLVLILLRLVQMLSLSLSVDYGKYLFEKAKAAKEQKKAKIGQVKEIKLRPGTDVGDYQVKRA